MILVDLNQVIIAGLMVQLGSKKTGIDENLIRHIALNTIRSFNKKYKQEYGDMVICCDNRNYWRKEVFPFYKAGRKKAREKSDLDWARIFDMLGTLKNELRENFPYKVIDVDGAEADDIIGTLAPRHVMHENVLILSSDGDFLQLQKYNNQNTKFQIKQYNPAQKKFVKSEKPLLELKEKIIRGDKGDGIPNILSPADTFVREVKSKAITKSILSKYLNEEYHTWQDETAKIGYSRNNLLINLDCIPGDVRNRIIEAYDNAKPAPRMKLFNYFVQKKLKNLMDVIEGF